MSSNDKYVEHVFNKVSKLQKYMHGFTEDELNEGNQNTKLMSNYLYRVKKSPWEVKVWDKFNCTINKDNVIYTINNSYHILMHSILIIKLPTVMVKQEYMDSVEICWCDYPGLVITGIANLNVDKERRETLDRHSIYLRHQFMREHSDERTKLWDEDIGRGKLLTNWNFRIEADTLKVKQPWYYTKSGNQFLYAIPYFLCKDSLIEHEYNFELSIANLLRMRVKDNATDEWVYKKVNMDYIEVKDTESDNKNKLEVPDLYGLWSKSDETQIQNYKDLLEEEKELLQLMDTLEGFTSTKEELVKDNTFIIPMNTFTPSKAIYGYLENQDEVLVNNYFMMLDKSYYEDLYVNKGSIEKYPIKNGKDIFFSLSMSVDAISVPFDNCFMIAFGKLTNAHNDACISLEENFNMVIKTDDKNNRNKYKYKAFVYSHNIVETYYNTSFKNMLRDERYI